MIMSLYKIFKETISIYKKTSKITQIISTNIYFKNYVLFHYIFVKIKPKVKIIS